MRYLRHHAARANPARSGDEHGADVGTGARQLVSCGLALDALPCAGQGVFVGGLAATPHTAA